MTMEEELIVAAFGVVLELVMEKASPKRIVQKVLDFLLTKMPKDEVQGHLDEAAVRQINAAADAAEAARGLA